MSGPAEESAPPAAGKKRAKSGGRAPKLPPGFAHLEAFADDWGLASDVERNAQRLRSELPQLKHFYDAMLGSLDDILAHLGTGAPESMTPESRRLLRMAFSFCEVSTAVELYRQPGVVDGFDPARFPRIDVPHMTPPEP